MQDYEWFQRKIRGKKNMKKKEKKKWNEKENTGKENRISKG